MSHNGDPVTGTFVWYDLKTRDPEAAWRFYGGLFGWQRIEGDRPETASSLIRSDRRDLGTIAPIDPRDRLASHWIAYVSVRDVDAAATAAVQAGGKVQLPPTDVPGHGRFAVLLDPSGASLSPFQWTREPNPALPTGPRAFCWSELLTPDPKAAAGFYSRVFGWTMDPGHPGGQGPYWLLRRAGRAVAGIVRREPGAELGTQWLHYVKVEGIEAATKRVGELGGKILVPPTLTPRVGRFVIALDPAGVPIALFEGEAGR